MPKIFISYRRDDSQHITGRIYDRLESRFGKANVFMDVDSIPFGVDFREHLDRAVGRCDVLLAIIGERWLDVRGPKGSAGGGRRLDDPADFVRIEIQSALARRIPVIPVLVDGAAMPGPQGLPKGLRDFSYRNAAEVRTGRDFRDHMNRLIQNIKRVAAKGGGRSRATTLGWAIGVLLMMCGLGVFLWMVLAHGPTPNTSSAPLDPVVTNSIGMKLKLIKAGIFKMGSPDSDKEASDDEKPQHDVEITRPFYLGVYPVTKAQFAAFVSDADYKTEAEQAGDKETWRTPNFLSKYDQTDDDPVVNVSWNDADQFCQWLSRKERKTYGLPTEAQWEYACRAGTTTAYSFGDDPKMLGEYAWYFDNSGTHTHPVGGKPPNPWGLYDMHGNVWQWCADYYDPKYYQDRRNKDPQNTLKTDARVFRGGSWASNAGYCRSACRYWFAPGLRSIYLGLRVCFRLD